MSGRAHRKAVAAPLAILAFWCGMARAAHAYPGGYDWLYQTISVLLYPDHNPRGYLWAWAGLELCGLAGLAWTTALDRRSEGATARTLEWGRRMLQLGFLCMCCTVLPDELLPLSNGHELFALLAFLGLCLGLACQLVIVGDRYGTGRDRGALVGTKRPRVIALLTLLPLVLAGLTQAYLTMVRPDLPWVSPRWRTLGISPFLSFGLWEWISAAELSAGLLLLWFHGRPTVGSPEIGTSKMF